MRLIIISIIVIPAYEPESIEKLVVLGIPGSTITDSGSETGMTDSLE